MLQPNLRKLFNPRSLIAILGTVFKEGCDAFGKQRLRNKAEKRKK